MNGQFRALMLEQADGAVVANVRQLNLADLPDLPVLVRVHYSTLNYKDGLAITGKGRIARHFPMVAGIDLAGEVVDAGDSDFSIGDLVLCTGNDLGEDHWGGLAEYARLDAHWPLPIPEGWGPREAMIMGTGGLTAALGALTIRDHGITPDDGPVLVTGAGGGVGGVAVMLLASLGYEVHAVSGRAELDAYLRHLGASEVLPREQFARDSKPLERALWAAVSENVGGQTLATAIAQTRPEGILAACGNAGGAELHTSVFPFILRGVTLRGIHSVHAPRSAREAAWSMLREHMTTEHFSLLLDREIGLSEVPAACDSLLAGQVRGRILVNLQV